MITNHLFENVILFIKYIGNNKIADLWNVIAIKSQNRNKKNRLFNKYL